MKTKYGYTLSKWIYSHERYTINGRENMDQTYLKNIITNLKDSIESMQTSRSYAKCAKILASNQIKDTKINNSDRLTLEEINYIIDDLDTNIIDSLNTLRDIKHRIDLVDRDCDKYATCDNLDNIFYDISEKEECFRAPF